MTFEDLQTILKDIHFQDWKFIAEEKGDGFLVQAEFMAADTNHPDTEPVTQKTRKWYISSHATSGEVVKTALLCVLTAHEHEIRELFKYRGIALFHPHSSISALASASFARDTRAPMKEKVKG